MSTDEKYLLTLKDFKNHRFKVFYWYEFSEIIKNNKIMISPESVFLLLLKKKWVNIHGEYWTIDKVFNQLLLGIPSDFGHWYWSITKEGKEQLLLLTDPELFKKNNESNQLKLDI